jgi:hypothetical protein
MTELTSAIGGACVVLSNQELLNVTVTMRNAYITMGRQKEC